MNDSPVDCQSRGVTEPQRDGGPLAVEGIRNKSISSCSLSPPSLMRHLPLQQGEAWIISADFMIESWDLRYVQPPLIVRVAKQRHLKRKSDDILFRR